jgi:membrane protein DedA with SNARE-associated domain/rhodanese-related sulfurtransferase
MQHFASLIEQFGLLIVFANVLLEQGGLPLPSWPMLIVAGALGISGAGVVPPLITAAAAAVLADTGWYFAGARWGRKVLATLCRISLSPDSCVRQTESIFTRIGLKSLLFVKLLPGLGLVTVTMAGITGVSLPVFLLLDGIGAALFVAVPILLGRIFHDAVDIVLVTLAQLGEWGALLLVTAFAVYICARWIKRQAFIRQLRMDRITVGELAEMMSAGRTPLIFDVRSVDAQRDGIIPGARLAPSRLDEVLGDFSRDSEIVVYCACPNEASAVVVAQQFRRAGFKTIRPLLGGIEAWAKAGYPVANAA